MKVADPEEANILLKHRVIEFFRMGGFLHMQELHEEQKKLLGENETLSDSEDEWTAFQEDSFKKKSFEDVRTLE